ncbi:Copper homeostasis protein CutC [Andreprevotia sp. IGB-42]|uniref:copper homeostasis protein CutC n=1 Tax=Andreprevotia sp. IGB-42 TaxID=2497473 RepID=UPI00135915AE|nr:copper homeostasis protein CutC [Andreprevotia sp. IGB-42]KAF0814632.1 Copper homeostasis protein CutC [Andreprevotia sp. IGB-42]
MSTVIDLEICAGSVASALAAQEGGAVRVELCDNLLEGGTTPSFGTIAAARDRLWITLNVIIRPRGGDFLYSDDEFETMRRDVLACKKIGVDGVVIGLLTADGDVDVARTRELVALATPMQVTFHRAFDVARDPVQALEDIIACGCNRLLSSGQEPTALQGAALLAQLQAQAAGRLAVMPGAGVRANNIAELVRSTGCREFHTSARAPVPSGMRYRNERVKMGGPGLDEYSTLETSADMTREIIRLASDAAPG